MWKIVPQADTGYFEDTICTITQRLEEKANFQGSPELLLVILAVNPGRGYEEQGDERQW
ncbi:hypothetical protein [Desulfogranum mediterraneum]|uniref:hypothetical protein n=1 Tax=Desulfogranum mediterraneum TaxID=160661 RepID=UPI00137754F0|nr:hypothetical protein [Desulfogranum mediterraneum]